MLGMFLINTLNWIHGIVFIFLTTIKPHYLFVKTILLLTSRLLDSRQSYWTNYKADIDVRLISFAVSL
jgi:hypothetical protein